MLFDNLGDAVGAAGMMGVVKQALKPCSCAAAMMGCVGVAIQILLRAAFCRLLCHPHHHGLSGDGGRSGYPASGWRRSVPG